MHQIQYTVDQIVEILVKHQAMMNGLDESEDRASAPLQDVELIHLLKSENRRLRILLIEALLDKAAFEEVLGRE